MVLPVSILMGGALGEAARRVSRRLIANRIGLLMEPPSLNGQWGSLQWILAGALGCGAIAFWSADPVKGVETAMIFLVLVSISAVDDSIRKIPNELLLMLLILKLGAVAASGSLAPLLPALAGMVVGAVVFIIPSKLGIFIGWGDIKMAAAAGFCLGVVGVLQAVLVMGAIIALYSLYLIITKRGGMKTRVAIGPPLSLGMMVSLLLPLSIAV
ncbi:MAG: prepilin peptidase [Christensenellales bacterium]|jgi:prepilin signal peptidase PulO-like enzyme (type II secretory pathway)